MTRTIDSYDVVAEHFREKHGKDWDIKLGELLAIMYDASEHVPEIREWVVKMQKQHDTAQA